MHVWSLERLERCRVAVGPGTVVTFAFHLELDFVVGERTQVAVLINDLDRDERQILAVGLDLTAVGHEFYVVRFACGVHLGFGHRLAVFIVSHHFHRSRFILGVHPHQAVTLLAQEACRAHGVFAVVNLYRQVLCALALALAVDEHFGRGVVGVDEYRRHFAFAAFPVPVWQYVQRFGFLVPVAAVEVIAVFRQACKVENAEQRGVAWPIAVIRSGFAKVVKAGPHKFAYAIGEVVVLDEVVFGQVRPTAVFNVVGRCLVVGIFLHRAANNREFVHTAGTYRRGCFAAENDLLRQLVVVDLVLVRAVVESRHVHHGSHVVVDNGIGVVHALSYGACGVFAVANVLQVTRDFGTVIVALVGNFVADAPHHHAGVVAELVQQVHHVFFRPFVEELVVAVVHLRSFPFVKCFGHHHHTHFVAGTYQLGCRHVVGSAYCVATHVLENANLAANTGIVGNAAERAEVVVVAHAAEVGVLAVKEEALAGDKFKRAHAEGGGVLVFQRRAFIYFRHGGVQSRVLGRPQRRVVDNHFLHEAVAIVSRALLFGRSHYFAGGIFQFGNDSVIRYFFALGHFEFRNQIHLCKIIFYLGCSQLSSPHGHMGIFGYVQMHVAVKSRTRIPA